jgi:hypothetical protein
MDQTFYDLKPREESNQGMLHKVTGFVYTLSVLILGNSWIYALKLDDLLSGAPLGLYPGSQVSAAESIVRVLLCSAVLSFLDFYRYHLAIFLKTHRSQLRPAIWPQYTLKGIKIELTNFRIQQTHLLPDRDP